ncbi:hypothetical protein GA0070606_5882 [Micromonospora citrea]|uniref:Major Facilitator Superfamily protein n=1 Tax=Micromonospora citrea TaxID=47855 RepID=A0A1C6W003_9ACTN|nr:hypothetical protein [Micromonospora citrea]SCL71929.1 hypothetical protein GA0070606_5882 [Micromonospora citrea]
MRGRLGTLTALYVTQYLGIGFITVGLTAILRDGGTSLDTLALLQVVGLVWPVKFLWAPILDRYGSRHRGHSRSWLLVLQGGLVLALLALLPFDRPAERLGPVVAVCLAYMDYSRPGTGGTDFTVLSSFGLVCSFVAAWLALVAADLVGDPAVAVASVVLVALGVAAGVGHRRRFRRPAAATPVEWVPAAVSN